MKQNLKVIWGCVIGVLALILLIIGGMIVGHKNEDKKDKEQLESGNPNKQEMDYDNQRSANALDTAMDVLGLPYLANQMHTLYYIGGGEYWVESTRLEQSGIISADAYDYDKDGQDEIFVVVILGGQESSLDQSVLMHMLELDDAGNWYTAASYDQITSFLYSMVCPGRTEWFIKDTGDQVYLYLENTGISQYFADGEGWNLTRFQYRDQSFVLTGEPVGISGSDDVSWACLQMNPNYEYEQEYIRDFIDQVYALDVHPTQLGWEYPITDHDSSLRSIVRVVKTNDFTYDEVWAWQNTDMSQPLGNVNVLITDYSKPVTETETEVFTEAVNASIVSYPDNPDIRYPQFAPSSPTIDAWNAYFLDMAAQCQEDENNMILEGIDLAEHSLEAEIMYREGNLVSIRFMDYVYAGGAHGSYRTFGKTIDLASDHEYTLAELLNTDMDTAIAMVNAGFNQAIAQNPDYYFPEAQSNLTTADYDDYIGYYKTADGIKVYGGIYWLAAYAFGEPEITLQPMR